MTALAEILVVAKDPLCLTEVRVYLESAHFAVHAANNTLQAQAFLREKVPEIVICDSNFLGVDGDELLQTLRGHERTQHTPFIVLATKDAVEEVRSTAGLIHAVLVQPLNQAHFLRVVESLLKNRVTHAVGSQTMTGVKMQTDSLAALLPGEGLVADANPHTLPMHFGQFLESSPATMMTLLDDDDEVSEDDVIAQAISKRTTYATVLFSDIRDFTSISERLRSDQVVQILNAYFARACEPIQRQHGWVVKFLGDGLVALFESPDGHTQDHAERAVKTGLLMILAATRFRAWMAENFPGVDLPPFSIGVGIHTGEVTVCKMGGGESLDTTIIGDTVNTAARLEEKTKELGWSLIVSQTSLDAAGPRILTGQRSALTVKGRTQPIDVVEVVGLQPKLGQGDNANFYKALSTAVGVNSHTLRRKLQIHASASAVGTSFNEVPHVTHFRMLRKLGEGGMSLVYLAQREADDTEVVLKMLPLRPDSAEDAHLLQRFLQEYALISQIHHHNIARIFEQGFTETHAYIALEYFPGGDLRSLIKSHVPTDVAEAILMQVANALSAIHARGIVHRDLKPENVMLRHDGSLAIADFGIAKHPAFAMTQTRHGEVFGTPYYLSPEQALGKVVDARSDIYSLGVMFYELLTCRKPYYGDNVQSLLYQHVHGIVPQLPTALARYQPLLDRLMAKDLPSRFQKAEEIIEEVLAL